MPTFRRSATLEARDGTVPELPEDFMARVRGINLVQSNALPTRNPTPAVDQSMGRRLRGRLVVRRGFPNSYAARTHLVFAKSVYQAQSCDVPP
jgi:hypothetical protein